MIRKVPYCFDRNTTKAKYGSVNRSFKRSTIILYLFKSFTDLLNSFDFGKNRSSRPEVFSKKGVLRNSAKFTGKHLYQRLFLNKVAGLRHESFPVNFENFLRIPFLQNAYGRRLLKRTWEHF